MTSPPERASQVVSSSKTALLATAKGLKFMAGNGRCPALRSQVPQACSVSLFVGHTHSIGKRILLPRRTVAPYRAARAP